MLSRRDRLPARRFAACGIRTRVLRTGLPLQPARDLLIQFGDLRVVKVEVTQLALQQEAVMRA